MSLTKRLVGTVARPQVILVGAVVWSSAAHAMVTQPTGEVMPQPSTAAEINVVTSRGFAADADTLAGLFKYHTINGVAGGDISIDPIVDAQTTPETFSPQCGLSGTIVLHGGSCKNGLGWYNAQVPPTSTPANIYPLVPANLQAAPPAGISCADNDFCPLATRTTTQIGQHTWANPLPDFAGNIRTDPNWKGGPVGFALIGVPGTLCTQTKYTQAELNDQSPSGKPWVTTLIYQSVADTNAYYIAFEDLPTCPSSWKGCNSGMANDGDFNDFVFYVSGLSCSGGGQPCIVDDPTVHGVCANGVTQCVAGGTSTTCKAVITPQPEVCDGVDNDCNGMVDDGADLCASAGQGWVCDHGRCVGPCNSSEFPCQPGYECVNTLCVEKSCVGNTCNSDQVCIHGVCTGGCDGVTCPYGSDGERQRCQVGQCVDACAGVTCDSSTVCEGGACQPPCGACRDCAANHTCVTSGTNKGICVKTGCENVNCSGGQVCVGGSCTDPCTGATCPGGQACMNGSCVPTAIPDGGAGPGTGTGNGGNSGGGGTTGAGGGSSLIGNAGSSGGSSTTLVGNAGSNGSGGSGAPGNASVSTCKCDTADGPSPFAVTLLAAAFLFAALRRRRTATARSSARRPRG
jgi:MYXO-CTERM domain-containing protein